ncbi:MAG: pilin [Minisyncoccales bacterium]
MNIKTIITTVFLFLIASPVFAAIQYPEIGGITINENTSAATYIVYFFNLAVALGAFAAVVMMIMAGIEWVTAAGNPGKIESAKGKIANTLFGVAVLVGCYLILNTINDQLLTVKIDDLACDHGVVVTVLQTSDKKQKTKCIDNNLTDIEKSVGGTILNTTWKAPKDYFLKVYLYSENDFKGTITQIDCRSGTCSGNIAGAKSIYFLLNKPGIYLYDDNSYTPRVKSYPLFTSISISDLSKKDEFDNFTRSIEIINPDQAKQQIKYTAVVFKDQNYQGRCAFVAQSVSDMDDYSEGYYTDSVGDDEISSIIVAKSNLSQEAISETRGKIIFYSKVNCGKSDTDPTKQIKSCAVKIESVSSGLTDIFKQCAGASEAEDKGFVENEDEVMSFEITGAAGLVLSTAKPGVKDDKTYCMYFDKADLNDGTCYSSIIDTHIFTVGGITPKSYIIVPEN